MSFAGSRSGLRRCSWCASCGSRCRGPRRSRPPSSELTPPSLGRMLRRVAERAREDHPMFLRNCWYVAGWSEDFAEGALVSRTILDEPIVLYRTGDGIAALED